ncbi:MAG: rhomboid family intramembrane serine protease, partial [Proteobacteria bacterium]|nr:rhomboid family intramembrane serine protease [Pseudomonadota bacterium]
SYGFLHAGLVHFGLNMATLFSLGPPVERVAGGWRFLACYLILLVAGGLGFALVPAALAAPMIGASGALFGLAGMILAWDYQIRARRRIPILPVLRSVAMLVVLNGLLWLAMGGRLAWQTHLGGFVGGWLLALWVRPR